MSGSIPEHFQTYGRSSEIGPIQNLLLFGVISL
jgi:hypothetical protein